VNILIADKLSAVTVKALEDLGARVTMNPELTADDLPSVMSDHEILIVRSTKVTAKTIEAAPSLSLIIRAGAGVNTIDLETASAKGIHVANCPGKNTDAVAELAIGLLIAADRRIADATADLRSGIWKKKEYGKARGLKGRTLGIIGLGNVGRAVAERAKGLEMNVIAWSLGFTAEEAKEMGIGFCESPEAVAEQADAVTIHVAAVPETEHFCSKRFFAKMKDGAIFINTSRGEVVDTKALKAAILDKGLRVGLDVFENEPAATANEFNDKELAKLVACTPHIGASTDQASEAIAAGVVDIVKSYQITGVPINAVNIREKSSAIISLVVRHYNRVGVLAGVLDALREDGINIEEMENTIFAGGKTASCTLRLDDEPSAATIQKIKSSDHIIQVMLKK
jgi:D-3-phosphoglycerate dehydrogenase